jgi:aminomethyltransferase
MTTTDPTTTARQYHNLRRTVGVYAPGAGLVAVTGLERGVVLGRVLARDSEYVEPNTARDTLVLNEDGTVWDAVIHIELDDTSWLISQSRTDLASLLRGAAEGLDDVAVADAGGEQEAVAFEGPKAWRIAEKLVDFEVSSLVLHGVAVVEPPAASGEVGVLARIGTTGEYGYVLVAPRSADAPGWVLEQAGALGGGAVAPEALSRARAEVRHPQIPVYSKGLSVREAGMEWLVSWNREDEFRGGTALVQTPEPERGLIHLTGAAGSAPVAGAAIYAGDQTVGTVREVFPAAGTADELVLGLLTKPFDIPGLTLRAAGADGSEVELRTVAAPFVVPQSWSERIGA